MVTALLVAGFVAVAGEIAVVAYRHAGTGDEGAIPGTASGFDVTAAMSRFAMWLTTAKTRPHTRVWPWSPLAQLGIKLGSASWWGWLSRAVCASFEAIVMVLGPPGTGKTGWIAGRVRKHPGPNVNTSTSIDVYVNTITARREVGPCWVFNPENTGNLASTMRWNLVEGCENPREAILRAGALISGSSTDNLKDGDWWESHAHRTLSAQLMAAALDGLDMRAVAAWADDLTDAAPAEILRQHRSRVPAGWARKLEWLQTAKSDKTVEGIFVTLKPVVDFMAESNLAAVVTPAEGEEGFSAERLLRENGTLYIVTTDREHGSLGPLTSALTSHVHETAKRLGASKRLDPPLLEALDEAALTCRVPLQRWTSDARKHGICILIGLQNRSQLVDVWGDNGAATIWSNSTVKMVFGSIDDTETLDKLSKLGGDRIGQLNERNERVPVLTPDRIKRMPDFHASVFYRDRRPVAPVKVDLVWNQRGFQPEHPPQPQPAATRDDRVVRLDDRRRERAS